MCLQAKEEAGDNLRLEQTRLAERGVPIMVLQVRFLAQNKGDDIDFSISPLPMGNRERWWRKHSHLASKHSMEAI